MTRKVTAAGEITGIPGIYQNRIDLDGGSKPGVLESGVVCIVGPCEGKIQPLVPYYFRKSHNLQEQLGSGELFDAARFAFNPSRDDPQEIRGAQQVIAVRANPATQSTLTLQSGAAADLIDLTSVGYGEYANQITATVAAGTDGALGKKLTIGQTGESNEVGDNLGYLPVFIIRYTNLGGSTCALTISDTALTTLTAGPNVPADDLSLSFTTYNTISKLVAAIDAHANYEAVAVTNTPGTYLCSDLDRATAQAILTVTANITCTATATTVTLAGCATGDIIKCESEYMYITTAGAPNTVIRGYLDSTAAAHTAASAVTFDAGGGVNKAMIDWCNTYSARVNAARDSVANVGVPAVLAATYLTGGGEGSIGNSDWENALKAMRGIKYNYIVVTSNSSTVHGYLKTHLNDKWGLLGQEALGHVGADKDETLAQIKTRAKALQSANICLWFQDTNRENDEGVDTNYDPYAQAAMAAGIQAGSAIGTPLTNKSLNISALGQNTAISLVDDATTLIDFGICFARYDGEDYRIVRALTSYTNTDDAHMIEPSNRTALAWTVYKVRYWVKFRHLGKKALTGSALSIKSTARTALEECRDVDEAIVNGSKWVGGRVVKLPGFSDLQVEQTGNVATLSYACIPVNGTDFVLVNTKVQPFQDVA